ncbi:hypothetical protein CVT26_015316 [Gymnopilus dilepis]|uniref:Uncharacterized protein n=1 Tax=Gymnopilus dilepis TaxID=231916 RepID=A0A409W492_9AGAR|nr:hypothetical protein CVT26_015316 [Gymnopilus dilepis]
MVGLLYYLWSLYLDCVDVAQLGILWVLPRISRLVSMLCPTLSLLLARRSQYPSVFALVSPKTINQTLWSFIQVTYHYSARSVPLRAGIKRWLPRLCMRHNRKGTGETNHQESTLRAR